MYRFFNQKGSGYTGLVRLPEINYLERTIEEAYTGVIGYYRTVHEKIDSRHLLFKLLTLIDVDWTKDPLDIIDELHDRSDDIAKRLRITSELGRYSSTKEEFLLPRGVNKLLINDNDRFDLVDIEDTWMDLEPIQYVKHESTNLTFPRGDHVDDTQHAIISINIPMFAIQYQQYLFSMKAKRLAGNPEVFFHRYPLNNAKKSFFNHAIYNRVVKTARGIDIPRYRNKHPGDVPMFDTSRLVDKVIDKYLVYLANRSYRFDEMLLLLNWGWSNAQDLMTLPDVRDTVQTRWAWYLARADVALFLLQIDEDDPHPSNSKTKQYWRAKIRNYAQQQTVRTAPLPFEWKKEFMELNDSIYEMVKK